MIIRLFNENPNPRSVQQIVNCLNKGGLAIVPTDTVYAVVCSINHIVAIETIAQIRDKKAKIFNFSIICSDIAQVAEITKPIPNTVFKLLKKNLPGPFTFILPTNHKSAKILKCSRESVGIRIPDNNITIEIVKTLGHPLITMSVKNEDNIVEYITDPELIHEQYGKNVEIVVDGGIGSNEGSTVVDCTAEYPEIIRQGIRELVL